MSPQAGRIVRLAIEKIVYPGRRLARKDGRVFFADEGLPGESIEAEILAERSSYVEARTVSILEASPRRIAPRCSHFLACGSYQTMPYPDQLEVKKAQARELFAKVLPPDAGTVEIVPSPREWRYRNKIRFSLIGSGAGAHLAYHLPGSREEFVEADEGCFLASETASEIAATVLSAVRKTGTPHLAEVEIRESVSEGTRIVNLFWRTGREETAVREISEALRSRFSPAGLVSWIPRPKGKWKAFVEWGSEEYLERTADTVFEIGAGSFFQVNLAILPMVIESVAAAAGLTGRETAADVYGGVGTFGLTLAKKARRITVVESDPDNVRRLEANIIRNAAANVEVRPGQSERWMEDLADRGLDVAVFDPPRKGLDPRVIQALLEHPIGKIIYLSCNPSTLARDIGLLKTRYALHSLRLFDFFPQTPHIETLASLHWEK